MASLSKIQQIAALAADAGSLQKQVETFIAHTQMLAQDGLTLTEVGQIFGEFTWLAVHAAEDLQDASGEDKKAAVLAAVSYLYGVVAPFIPLPWFVQPFRSVLREPIRQIVLLTVSGLIEVIVAKMNAAKAIAPAA
jgi:hypothetical protein